MGPGQQRDKERGGRLHSAFSRARKRQAVLRRRSAAFPRDLFRIGVPLIAVSGCCDYIHFFRLDTRERVFRIWTGGDGRDLIQSTLHNRPVLAVGGQYIYFVDLKTREKLCGATISRHSDAVSELINLPSDSFGDDLIASASYDNTVRVWKKEEEKQVRWNKHIVYFEGHEDWVRGLCCIPFKKWLVSGSFDNTVRVWDFQTQRGVPDGIIRDHTNNVYVTQYHEKHRSIFSGSDDKTIRMFSLDGFRCVKTFQGSSGSCNSLLLHPTNENSLFSGHYGSVRLWDIRKEEKCVTKRTVHDHIVRRIVHVGGNRFASCSDDKTVKFWMDHDYLKEVSGADGEVAQIRTNSRNLGLCCLVPFSKHSARPQAERIADSQRRSAQEEEAMRRKVAACESEMREILEVEVRRLAGQMMRREEASASRIAVEELLLGEQVELFSADRDAFDQDLLEERRSVRDSIARRSHLSELRREEERVGLRSEVAIRVKEEQERAAEERRSLAVASTERARLSELHREAEDQSVKAEVLRRDNEEQERRLRWFLRMIHMEKFAPLLIDGGIFYDDLSRFLRRDYEVALLSTLSSAFATAKLLLNIPRRVEFLHLRRSDYHHASREQEREEGLRSFLSEHRLGKFAPGMLAEGVGFDDLHSLLLPSFEEAFTRLLPAFPRMKLAEAIRMELVSRATLSEGPGMIAFTTLDPIDPAAAAASGPRDDGSSSPAWMLHASNVRIFRDRPPLGEGSYGKVFEGEVAVGLRIRAKVAVKRISLRHVEREAVKREVEFLASLDHEFVLRADGCYFDEDYAFLVTELCEKGSLPDYLESETPELALRLTILKNVAVGMQYLHQRGVYHRDLKPANVLMTAENVVKICDFGISKHEGSSTSGGAHGTPRFIPKSSSPRTARECDVYAFGILSYEVLSDKKAFESLLKDYQGAHRLAAIHQRGVLPNLDVELSGDVPIAAKKAIQSCWSDDPSDWPAFHDLVVVLEGVDTEEEEEEEEEGEAVTG